MSDLASLYIKVDSQGVKTASENLKGLTDEGGKAETATAQFQAEWLKIAGAAGAVIAAIAATVKVVKELTDAYAASELAAKGLEYAFVATGQRGADVRGIKDLATELQNLTGISDDATVAAGTMLVRIAGLSDESVKRAIPAIQDLSAGLGMDLASAANLVGKALEGNVSMLGRYGIHVEAGTTSAQTFENVLAGIEKNLKGTAIAMGDTLAGSTNKAKEALGDLAEVLGSRVAVQLKTANEGVAQLAQLLSDAANQGYRLSQLQIVMPNVNVKGLEQAYTILSPGGSVGTYKPPAWATNLLGKGLGGVGTKEPEPLPPTPRGWGHMPWAYDQTTSMRESASLFGSDTTSTIQEVLAGTRELVGPTTTVADLWGDISQYESRTVQTHLKYNSSLDKSRSEWENIAAQIDASEKLFANFYGTLEKMAGSAGLEALRSFGELIGAGELTAQTFGSAMEDVLFQLTAALPMLFLTLGLELLIKSMGADPLGWVLLGLAGFSAIGVGIWSGVRESEQGAGGGSGRPGGQTVQGGSYGPTMSYGSGGVAYGRTIAEIGESGPEAVIPLVRGPGGRLGVGGGGGVQVVMNNYGPTFGSRLEFERAVGSAVAKANRRY